jgi:hypothetical protein
VWNEIRAEVAVLDEDADWFTNPRTRNSCWTEYLLATHCQLISLSPQWGMHVTDQPLKKATCCVDNCFRCVLQPSFIGLSLLAIQSAWPRSTVRGFSGLYYCYVTRPGRARSQLTSLYIHCGVLNVSVWHPFFIFHFHNVFGPHRVIPLQTITKWSDRRCVCVCVCVILVHTPSLRHKSWMLFFSHSILSFSHRPWHIVQPDLNIWGSAMK